MPQRQIIVLEGLPASGKTSLANYLRDNFGGYKVNESSGALSKNTGNQRAIFQDTIKKYSAAITKSGLIIIDRGYPSLLAWDFCREQKGYAHDYLEKLNWIEAGLRSGELYEPNLYIYLRITYELSFQRRSRQTDIADIWSNKEGIINCIEFYEKFFKQTEQRKRTLIFDGALTSGKIADSIINLLKFNA